MAKSLFYRYKKRLAVLEKGYFVESGVDSRLHAGFYVGADILADMRIGAYRYKFSAELFKHTDEFKLGQGLAVRLTKSRNVYLKCLAVLSKYL